MGELMRRATGVSSGKGPVRGKPKMAKLVRAERGPSKAFSRARVRSLADVKQKVRRGFKELDRASVPMGKKEQYARRIKGELIKDLRILKPDASRE
jgi:hypothetical protein